MGVITNMRSQMQVVMWTILVLFIVSMAIGGLVGGASIGDIFGQNSSDNIGSLNGKPILHEDFNRLVFDEIGRIESQSGETMSDEDREYVRAVVWERLIQDLLIQEQIEENEIVIGDDEVLYQLKNNPPPFLQASSAFQKDGRFDLERYMEAILNTEGDEWLPIEEFMRNIYLPNYKLQQLIIHSASTTEEDIRNSYIQRFVNYNIEVLHITDKVLEEETPQPSEKELMAAYSENVDDYKQPEMRYMKYVKWPIVSDYNDSLRVQLEAGNLIQRIHQGQSFSDIANAYSEDPGNSVNPDSLNGGRLGWFNKGQMVKEFEEAAFSGQIDEVIGPILTQFGYHIIKINNKRTVEDGEEQVNASHILLTVTPGKDTENKLRNLSSIFSLEAKEYGFFDLADSLNMEINDANGVQRASIFIEDIGVARNAVQFAFSSEEGEVSEYVENDNYFLVFYLDSISPSETMSFETVKESLIEESIVDIKKKQIEEIANNLLIDKENVNLSDLAETYPNFEYVEEATSTLIGSFTSIGKSNYVSGALLNAKEGDFLGPLPTIRGQAFIKVLSIDEISEEDFNEKKESLKFSLIIQRQNLIWSNWLQALRDDSDIEDNRFDFY
ncbi:MAG: SurA N-terminal domain-containing protein [Candidatus Neomarinimicrobiota bacterium]|nr:SurA N-terminal domain-containing protein [Candidatus Neomarinimicrobiota bacterium]MED5451005.1 SurA N-terminal domain-containing protein [Candidatus Neomarinimicrobiota bacterium]MEE3241830.1 SurA N-terminal domain-containing protein [Candidatus Neomarinimicrobiota bacterium]